MTTRVTEGARRERLFFLLGLPPSFLASRGLDAQRSRARALPLLNLKKREAARSLHFSTLLAFSSSFPLLGMDSSQKPVYPILSTQIFFILLLSGFIFYFLYWMAGKSETQLGSISEAVLCAVFIGKEGWRFTFRFAAGNVTLKKVPFLASVVLQCTAIGLIALRN